jgi:enoyl-CoA hydratase/carnithine racemase
MDQRMNAGHNMPESAVPVLFEERYARGGHRIGIATLNTPTTLNGLSLEMARLLSGRLDQWADDRGVALVILRGAGEKAFCAGGDLQGLYRSMRETRDAAASDIRANVYAADFFETEYRLDHRIHTYPKPVLCWGHGIVMGGGIGLMAGASHRVVTERSKLAFPEITVGLYPDVGGSWLLPRVPGHGGLFLALTGAPLDASDALYAGLADHAIENAHYAAVLDTLVDVLWSDDATRNRHRLTECLSLHAYAPMPGPLERHRAAIEDACGHDDLVAVVSAIEAIDSSDAWIAGAQKALVAGSPGSVRLSFTLQRQASGRSLSDTFRVEYTVSLHCAAHGDFAEGIRALLIDKDRTPHWNPSTLAEADPAWADAFFAAPWEAPSHPLADLGRVTLETHA